MNIEKRIIKKSTEMYLRLGFKSVTMDDIASEMGISKKTIYQHFKNKRAIVKAVTKALLVKITDGMDCILTIKMNPMEELFTIKDFFLKNLNDENTSTFYQLQKYYPQLYKAFLSKQFNKTNDWLIDNMKRGINQGLYRTDINLPLVCRFFIIGLKGIKEIQHLDPFLIEKQEIQKIHLEYHLRAISTPKGINFLESIIKTKKKK